MSDSIQPIIEFRGVSQRFGSKVILDNVDLKIYPGEAVGVIGPSGTGKSTILRIVSGLLTPNSGEVIVHGHRRQRSIEEGEKALGVGLVFQQSALFDSLTVAENIGFTLYRDSGLRPREIRAIVEDNLELVGLPGIGDRFPAELSGGMRKRVSLARAIVINPEQHQRYKNILLYDEPTAGLDPVASTRIESLIRHLLSQDHVCCCYLIVTHQFSTIERTTDRIIFLYEGKIQWDGSTADAYKSDHPLLKQFFSGSIDGPIS
ncbi:MULTISPECIES: ABC transporter ATP-binding protein [unclassified Synechocystis]|uniref:ABC transporter ATP-binding protein n=1 Tax=unclassified Synechocystis TaxID=2640012 RepID=UPI0004137BEA|nr:MULTISPECIES: ATP-binding cassette domain-containing protein [unclassified Synechocystis]AIE75453.1 ABC transporter ATP-binding protein [Synechocystis sp. PCC 6714]MCT0253673.1 ATP-binding cassette domain-containing protein [Synechocystis sp. CS-94]